MRKNPTCIYYYNITIILAGVGVGSAELGALAECSTAVNRDKDCALPYYNCSHGWKALHNWEFRSTTLSINTGDIPQHIIYRKVVIGSNFSIH